MLNAVQVYCSHLEDEKCLCHLMGHHHLYYKARLDQAWTIHWKNIILLVFLRSGESDRQQ